MMRKIEWGDIGILLLWIIVILVMLISGKSKAQDTPSITACYMRTDTGTIFTFSNIPDNWLGDTGWYYIGDDVKLEDHTLVVMGLQFDEGYSYAIVGANDYSESYTASTELTPECQKPTATPEAPVVQQAVSQPVMSTGRTCVIKYPEIILVCNG